MISAQLTASRHILPIAAFVEKNGEPMDRLLDQAGLPSTCLDDPTTLVPTGALWRFRGLAANRVADPNLTLTVMEPLNLGELGPVGRSLLDAPTLRKAILNFRRTSRAESSTTSIALTPIRGRREFFSTRFMLNQESGRWQAELYLLMWMLKIVRLIDPTWTPDEIWCHAKATPERLRAIELLAARPRFNQPCIGFAIPTSMLATTHQRGKCDRRYPAVHEDGIWATAPSKSISGAVKQLLMAYANDGWLTVGEVREVLRTSVRTLQREMSVEGKTFTEILEEARAESAVSLLEDTNASLTEIAHQLDYSSLSNFNRAFRRWAAVSPRQWRMHHAGEFTGL